MMVTSVKILIIVTSVKTLIISTSMSSELTNFYCSHDIFDESAGFTRAGPNTFNFVRSSTDIMCNGQM